MWIASRLTAKNGQEFLALVDDKVVFALDPDTKEYKFVGRVEANEGTFTGEVNAKSGKIAGFTISNGVLENKEEGR